MTNEALTKSRQFRIADTFTEALARLPGDTQKVTKQTVFDLQLDLAGPGLQFHRIENAKDPGFWSVRVGRDIRLIVHKSESSLLLCYVGHHDDAYQWASRRKFEVHPRSGAAQFVQIRERVEELVVRRAPAELPAPETSGRAQPKAPPAPRSIFQQVSAEDLLSFGVPPTWIDAVLAATDDDVLDIARQLPAEAQESVLQLATGTRPEPRPTLPPENPFAHPDSQRRFVLLESHAELAAALDWPWEKWTVFLHPQQREFVHSTFSGPARVAGSAGTGKTIVAVHRAVFLARKHPEARLLLGTFSKPLANALSEKLKVLLSGDAETRERIECRSMNEVCERLYKLNVQQPVLANRAAVREFLMETWKSPDEKRLTVDFLVSEWREVVDEWQISTWEEYRDVKRVGRKVRLPEAQRKVVWSVMESVLAHLSASGLTTHAAMWKTLTELYRTRPSPFSFAVIDESQDLSVAQLRFLAVIGASKPDALFFAGDLGQRIFQPPFSWASLGVAVRGRARTLVVNYRTSQQIRRQADLLLESTISDVDGNEEQRKQTVSVFDGPSPDLRTFESEAEEIAAVAEWIGARLTEGCRPEEIAVIVRDNEYAGRAVKAIAAAGCKSNWIDEAVATKRDCVCAATMHLAKGLEFRAVAVMACDDPALPHHARLAELTDETDLAAVYTSERQLLYVACTRAREHLLVTGVEPGSDFLQDLAPAVH